MKKQQSRKLSIETLETREVMAGNVNIFMDGTEMVIDGDGLANHVEIRDLGNNVFKISGVNGTTIDDGPWRNVFVQSGVFRVNLRNGADSLTLIETYAIKTINVLMGHGADKLTVNNSQIDNLTVQMGGGADVLAINSSSIINKAVLSLGGPAQNDPDTLDLSNSIFFDSVHARLGGGNDNVRIDGSEFRSIALFLGESGFDTFSLRNSRWVNGLVQFPGFEQKRT